MAFVFGLFVFMWLTGDRYASARRRGSDRLLAREFDLACSAMRPIDNHLFDKYLEMRSQQSRRRLQKSITLVVIQVAVLFVPITFHGWILDNAAAIGHVSIMALEGINLTVLAFMAKAFLFDVPHGGGAAWLLRAFAVGSSLFMIFVQAVSILTR
jgi:hypothetical protein